MYISESLSEKLKQRGEETASLLKKEKEYRRQIENIEDDYRKKELDLLNDLDFAQDKNEVCAFMRDFTDGHSLEIFCRYFRHRSYIKKFNRYVIVKLGIETLFLKQIKQLHFY